MFHLPFTDATKHRKTQTHTHTHTAHIHKDRFPCRPWCSNEVCVPWRGLWPSLTVAVPECRCTEDCTVRRKTGWKRVNKTKKKYESTCGQMKKKIFFCIFLSLSPYKHVPYLVTTSCGRHWHHWFPTPGKSNQASINVLFCLQYKAIRPDLVSFYSSRVPHTAIHVRHDCRAERNERGIINK